MESHDNGVHAGGNGLDANQLKLIAIVAMIIDHIGTGFFDYGTWPYIILHMIGRITGPTMFYFVAVGYRHTGNIRRYTIRLAGFALVSYLPYIYFHTGRLPDAQSWYAMNVIYTLLLGLLAIRAQHEIRRLVVRVPILIVLFVLSTFGDWGTLALLFMLAFDYYYGDRRQQAFAYLLVAASAGSLLTLFTQPFLAFQQQGAFDFSAYPGILYAAGMVFPLILLQCYNGRKGGGGACAKWGFYIVYPAHFLVLGFVKYRLMAL